MDTAHITWNKDGLTQKVGVGEMTYTTILGASGERTFIQAVITLGGDTITKNISYTPGTVDLVWQAVDSYTPPFYKGKALPSYESQIKITAITDAKFSQDTTYNWERDFKNKPDVSGFQKDTFYVTGSILETSHNIGVTVRESQRSTAASNHIQIPLHDPMVKIYPAHNQVVPFFSTTKPVLLGRGEVLSFAAIPYYFSTTNPETLSYTWRVNGNNIPNAERLNNILTLDSTVFTRTDSVDVSLSIDNPNTSLQEARTEIGITP